MSEEDAFIDAVTADPDDSGQLLAYADWLEKQGHPDGAFLRLQCALDGMSRWDEGYQEGAARERELYENLEAWWRDRIEAVLARVLAARWAACVARPGCVADPDCLARARRCLRSLMRRARWNVELLIQRLQASGYVFLHPEEAYSPPTRATLSLLDQFEQEGHGHLPLSVRIWVEEVGSVCLIGSHPAWPFTGHNDLFQGRPIVETNPLCVDVLRGIRGGGQPVDEFYLAPDIGMKAGYSAHILSIAVGDPALEGVVHGAGADSTEVDDYELPFIEHLRQAFSWGGFPGLENPVCQDGALSSWADEQFFDRLRAELSHGLRPF